MKKTTFKIFLLKMSFFTSNINKSYKNYSPLKFEEPYKLVFAIIMYIFIIYNYLGITKGDAYACR